MQCICFITIVHIYYFLLNKSLWTILGTKWNSGTLYSVPHTSLRMHKRYHLALYPKLGSWVSQWNFRKPQFSCFLLLAFLLKNEYYRKPEFDNLKHKMSIEFWCGVKFHLRFSYSPWPRVESKLYIQWWKK